MLIKRVAEAQKCFPLPMNIFLHSLPACDAAPLCTGIGACGYPTARLVGSRKVRCVSIVLSVFRRVSRQADRRGRSRTV